MCLASVLRHPIQSRKILLIVGVLIAGGFGCTSVSPPKAGLDGAVAGGAGGRDGGGGGAGGDAAGPAAGRDGSQSSDGAGGGRADGSRDSTTTLDGAGGATGGMTSGGSSGGVDAPVGGAGGATGGMTSGGSSGGVDAPVGGAGGATGGMTSGGSGGTVPPDAPSATGGITSTGGTTSSPDASTTPGGPDAGLTNGSSCTTDGQCASTHCVDGVCCESTCSGCNACSNATTGKNDGTCAPVVSGKDPHETCTDEITTKPCGNDGTCDGKGACRKVGAGQKCGEASCSADGKTFTPVATCDGNGICPPPTPQDCTPFQCGATGCPKICTIQAQCEGGNYCDTTAGTCATRKSNGSPATQTYECTSGVIADGVCCDKACTGCSACTATLNGQAANTTGQCLPVVANRVSPHNACTADLPCGEDGNCDGNGGCHYPSSGTSCAASTCAGSTLTTSKCDSAHACTPGPNPCPGSLICGSATACKTSCVGDGDCISGYYCASGTCTSKIDDGQACTPGADNQCKNGNCVAGACCHTACGECHTCANSTGTCNLVGNGTPCGTGVCNNGTCNACSQGATCTQGIDECHTGATDCSTGSPVCQATAKPTGTNCGSGPTCTGVGTSGKAYGHWTCQGGSCAQPTTYTSCPSTGCNTAGTACNNACDSGTQTICGTTCCTTASQYCSNNTSCAAKIQDGTACQSSDQCVHGNCSTYPATGGKVCCQSGYSNCSSTCVNQLTDYSNCGSCGHACGTGETCSGGGCGCALGSKMAECGACSGWTFDTGLGEWAYHADVASFTTSSSIYHGSSGQSLAVTFNANFGAPIAVTPCGGTFVSVPFWKLRGYFYSSSNLSGCQVFSYFWNNYTQQWETAQGFDFAGYTPGTWVQKTATMGGYADSTSEVGFDMGCPGVTIYIDDVVLSSS